MIDLVVFACLIASPGQCSHHTIGQGDSIKACQAAAIPSAAKWAGAHPAYEIKRIVCSGHGEDA